MSLGALDRLTPRARSLLITKYGHVDGELRESGRVDVLEAAHPSRSEQPCCGTARGGVRRIRAGGGKSRHAGVRRGFCAG